MGFLHSPAATAAGSGLPLSNATGVDAAEPAIPAERAGPADSPDRLAQVDAAERPCASVVPAEDALPAGVLLAPWARRPLARIEVTGNRRTRADVLLRELRWKPGAIADWSRLEDERQRLLDLELFAAIRFEVLPDQATGRPILRIEVRERPTLLVLPILQHDSEDGWIVGAEASESNLFGRHQALGLALSRGGRRGESIEFSSPWLAGRRLAYGVGLHRWRREIDAESLEEKSLGGAFSLRPSRGRAVSFPLEVGRERIRTRPWPEDEANDGVGAKTDRHGWLTMGVRRDTRLYRSRPRDGSLVGFSATRHGGPAGGNVDFTRLQLDLLQVLPTGGATTLTLAQRAQWSRGEVPPYLRLGLGGIDHLRGSPTGKFRGDSRWFAWVEERFALFPPWSFELPLTGELVDLTVDGALFVDGGTVWSGDALRRGRARGRWGAGAGLRITAPFIRLLSVDLATDGRRARLVAGAGARM